MPPDSATGNPPAPFQPAKAVACATRPSLLRPLRSVQQGRRGKLVDGNLRLQADADAQGNAGDWIGQGRRTRPEEDVRPIVGEGGASD